MDEQTRAALLNSQVACALIEAMGMQAENQKRIHRGETVAYDEMSFQMVIEKNGIGYNQAIAIVQGR